MPTLESEMVATLRRFDPPMVSALMSPIWGAAIAYLEGEMPFFCGGFIGVFPDPGGRFFLGKGKSDDGRRTTDDGRRKRQRRKRQTGLRDEQDEDRKAKATMDDGKGKGENGRQDYRMNRMRIERQKQCGVRRSECGEAKSSAAHKKKGEKMTMVQGKSIAPSGYIRMQHIYQKTCIRVV